MPSEVPSEVVSSRRLARAAAWACALAMAVGVVGCTGGIVGMQPVTVPASRAGESHEARFDRALSAARARGYEPDPVQPSRYRFGVRARTTDAESAYAIAVECFSDGSIHLTPIGARVELLEGRYELPEGLRDEIFGLATELGRAPVDR